MKPEEKHSMDAINRIIIDAVLEKERQVCPGCVDLIGIYGSFASGDVYPGSDLDLLILINDAKGWALGTGFILDDTKVGYDIYCTDWKSLEEDAKYEHPHIAKLMDSKIVYCANDDAAIRLEVLRSQVGERLGAPLDEPDFENAQKALREAEHFYAAAMAEVDLAEIRLQTGEFLYHMENAIALLNKTYFQKSVRRRYEELADLKLGPDNLCDLIENVISASSADEIHKHLTILMRMIIQTFRQARAGLALEKDPKTQKEPASADNLRGTYEEMFSNWRNKVHFAAETGDRYLAFSCMASLNAMISEIGDAVQIGLYDVMSGYDPDDLKKTADAFDDILRRYSEEYVKVGLDIRRFPDVEAFAEDYLG